MTHEQFEAIVSEGMSVVEKYSLPLLLFKAGSESTGTFQFATGSLVRVSPRVALITSGHVLEAFFAMGSQGRLQLGADRFVLKPSTDRIVRISKKSDLAILMLTEEEVATLGEAVLNCDQIVAREVRKFELIGFCGYPGATKALIGDGLITGKKYQLVGTVDTVEPDQFSIRTDGDRYEIPPAIASEGHYPLGGISGAPVFSFVTGEPHMQRRRRPALIGWVYEGHAWSSSEAKIYVVKATNLAEILPEAGIKRSTA